MCPEGGDPEIKDLVPALKDFTNYWRQRNGWEWGRSEQKTTHTYITVMRIWGVILRAEKDLALRSSAAGGKNPSFQVQPGHLLITRGKT